MIAPTSPLRPLGSSTDDRHFGRAWQGLYRGLQTIGRQRAASHLQRLAIAYADPQPAFAQQLRAAAQFHRAA